MATIFWAARWLHGSAPKEVAPGLYQIARFKRRNICTELRNYNWIKNTQNIQSSELMDEFVLLYMALSTIQLTQHRDTIYWKWSPNGQFTVASANDCQFHGAMLRFPASVIWKANAEQKCILFAWLVLHDRAPAADNLIKKNRPCNATCHLCTCLPETSQHLLTQCNYSEAVWNVTAPQFSLPNFNSMSTNVSTTSWVHFLTAPGSLSDKKRKLGFLFTFWCQVWKERNRRIFQDKEASIPQVASLLKEQLFLYNTVHQNHPT
jgi:hypothetical protein